MVCAKKMAVLKRLYCEYSSRLLVLVLVLSLSSTLNAFSVQQPSPTATSSSSSSLPSSQRVTRHDFLQRSVALVLGGGVSSTLLVSSPAPASAAVGVQSQLSYSAALRNVKSVQKKLEVMELYVTQDEYMSLKEALRVAPCSEIRKSCTTLARASGEETETFVELDARYKSFIAKLEKMDSTASVAMRGRTLKEGQLEGDYQATVAALDNFVVLAKEQVVAVAPVDGEEAAPVTQPTSPVD